MSKKIVVVGASRGIGLELVKQFAANPTFQIVALSRSLAEIENLGLVNVKAYQFDLEGDVKEQLSTLFPNESSIDVLVNNAGKLVNKAFTDLSKEDIFSCYQVNVMGVMQTLQFFIPLMLGNGGHVVNISSMGGFQGSVKFAGLSAYSTSKAAVVSLTELLAEEYKETKLKINCLCLGAVQTEMLREAFPGYEAPLSASEMANFIADFSLHAQRFFNGKILPVSLSTP